MIKNREEWVASLRDASLLPNPPIAQKDGKWKITDRLAAWRKTGPRIFDDYLDRFQRLAIRVFREKDPQFELAPKDRFMARSRGKTLHHSSILRNGLAETLALLGSFPKFLTSASQGKAETTAILTVREILKEADWIVWASIHDHLPMFAEAAPGEFLFAVENALAKTPSPFSEVFAQEAAGIMGRNYMTGLLWALETLAWSPDYLTRVVVLLGQVAAIDPGGNWANRPANSLADILLPWHPQTLADIPKRISAVRILVNEEPQVGWKLLLALLPQAHSVTSGTRKPTWREFIPKDWNDTITNKDYWDQVIGYADIAVEIATKNRTRLIELIDRIPVIPDPSRTRLLSHLESKEIANLSESDRQPIWEGLVKLAAVHRQYSDAEWAMDSDSVSKIEQIAKRLEPQSPSARHHRLFSGLDFELYEEKGDWETQERKLDLRRQDAVKEILRDSSIQGLIDFARSVSQPVKVGSALGVIQDRSIDAALLPNLFKDASLQNFLAGFVWARVHSAGWQWLDDLATTPWTEEAKVSFLTKLPFRRETWERAAQMLGDNTDAYWREVFPNAYNVAEGDLILAAELLLQHRRPRAAVQCLQRLAFEKHEMPASLVARALLDSISSDEPRIPFDQHATRQLIKWMQDNLDTTDPELFRVEWGYLPLLDRRFGGVSPKSLESRLASDPEFFCEIIRTIFRSKNEERSKSEPSEEKKKIAENAYRLLHEWSTPPGTTADDNWDSTAFQDWLTKVKKSTRESGHYEVAMSQVGQVLPFVPPDPSGLWIHETAAAALNAKDADEMRSGFTTKLFNMRGTHGFTHGREEREIAKGYREKAEAVEKATCHRLATTVRDLAGWYERDAEREAVRGPLGD